MTARETLLIFFLPPLVSLLLDIILGDPHWLYHPVRLIGKLISALEGLLRRLFPATRMGTRAAGAALALLTPLITMLVAGGLLAVALWIHLYMWVALETVFCWLLLALRSLQVESMRVYKPLMERDLPLARRALASIVGRDTGSLNAAEITRAAVETVAENTSDGVVAPLLYLFLGSSVMGWGYKAVNTLDSMVGYKNERYRHFGTASARLDDLLNLLPSRLAAVFMVAASSLCGLDGKGALRIWRRDRRNHPSPNSAQTEAACAGALGIRLGGGASYFGVWKDKPTIGDDSRAPVPGDIPRTNRLAGMTTFLIFLFFVILKTVVLFLIYRK